MFFHSRRGRAGRLSSWEAMVSLVPLKAWDIPWARELSFCLHFPSQLGKLRPREGGALVQGPSRQSVEPGSDSSGARLRFQIQWSPGLRWQHVTLKGGRKTYCLPAFL